MMTTPSYDTDFYAWTQAQAQALQARDWPALDIEHLTEEIADLGSSQRYGIESQLERLLVHLLKYRDDPAQRPWDHPACPARDCRAPRGHP
jgi:hypothetical protein